jgi:hypothetical protein
MENSGSLQLEREVRSFTKYLIGRPASERVAGRYADALAILDLEQPTSRFDSRLLRLGGLHPLLAGSLDTASAFLARDSLLRRRLFVLAGLLETEPSYADRFLRQPPGRLGIVVGLAVLGLRSALNLVVGTPLLLAIRWTP